VPFGGLLECSSPPRGFLFLPCSSMLFNALQCSSMLCNAAAMALSGSMSTESSFEEDCALRVMGKRRIDESRYGLKSSVRRCCRDVVD
jgi:hypothetical protein